VCSALYLVNANTSLAQKAPEARVGVQSIQQRVHLKEQHPVLALRACLVEAVECLVVPAQLNVEDRKIERILAET
jgi:hypothetical protein